MIITLITIQLLNTGIDHHTTIEHHTNIYINTINK